MLKAVVQSALFVAMTAPAEAMVAAPSVAGTIVTWEEIVAGAARTPPEPHERPNNALKHYRDRYESPEGVPNGMSVSIDLQCDSVLIRECTHGCGEQFWFEEGAGMVPWSWRQMLTGLGDRGENVVGPGFAASPCTSGRAPTITTVPTRR